MKKLTKAAMGMMMGIMLIVLIDYVVEVSYKKEILAKLNNTLGELINGDVKIGDLNITILHDFPNVSLSLKDIYLRGPRYAVYHKDFLRANAIILNVAPVKLLQKQIIIKSVDITKGEVFIFRSKDGYVNLDVFSKLKRLDAIRSELDKPSQISFYELNFENVSFTFYDSLKVKSFATKFVNVENKIINTDSSVHCHLTGGIDFAGLMFDSAKGSYLENKPATANISFEFFFPSRRLVIEQSSLSLKKSTINLSGALKFSLPEGNFQLNVGSDRLDYQEGLTVVTKQLRSKLTNFLIDKPVAIDVSLKGTIGSGVKPAVDVSFAFENSSVSWRKLTLQKTFVEGIFINHKDSLCVFDDTNSEIKLSSMRGVVKEFPFSGTASLNDMTNPFLNLNVTFDSYLKRINAQLDTTLLKFTAGRITSTVMFSGALNEYLDDRVTKFHGTLQGETKIKGGKLIYFAKNITFDHIQAVFAFTEKKFDITKISMRMNRNPISLVGSITGFIPLFLVPEKQGKVMLSINSPFVDFTPFAGSKMKSDSVGKTTQNKKGISNLIDNLYKKLEFDLDFKIDKIKSNNISGTNLTGNVLLASNRLNARNVKLIMAGGRVEFSSTLFSLQDEINPFALKASVRNSNIKELFYMFNNFKQNTIRSEHLDGKLSADINMTAKINDNFEVLMPHLVGSVKFNVREGRIRDFEPLENMGRFLFKKRDFMDVQFDEIIANFDIQRTELDIARMEVQSTVLTLFLEGRYSLKDSTNLSIQVPLSNLKKRDQNYVPENVGTHAKVGLSVYLRAYQGNDGKTIIVFDPFRKSKEKAQGKRK